GTLPALAVEAGVSAPLPQSVRLPAGPLARGLARRPGHGMGARDLLPRLLLGADGGAGGRRRDGAAVGAAHRVRGGGRKTLAARRVDCANDRRRAGGAGRDRGPPARSGHGAARGLDVTGARTVNGGW